MPEDILLMPYDEIVLSFSIYEIEDLIDQMGIIIPLDEACTVIKENFNCSQVWDQIENILSDHQGKGLDGDQRNVTIE